MVQIELTQNEIQVLTDLLENCISDLRVEISNTDNIGYKDMLHDRKMTLMKLLTALQKSKELPVVE